MVDYKYAFLWGVIGVVIGICAFTFNYYMVSVSLPGYKFLVAPAIFVLSFFSEETDFTPKMVLFLSGQFIGYLSVAYIYRKVSKLMLSAKRG
ncbi:hypothetical protein [Thalassotalea piscium]|uniref:Uncharacterized protein n=1 Tax=Thalassotalea piscium TaxID=1230533 RepID=A0A7X0TSX1_9GAMM|nr:hypothetical protein [Thalassotalea piscium]MBB6542581.1 hypothetical protein [Thalassotalea piscium]